MKGRICSISIDSWWPRWTRALKRSDTVNSLWTPKKSRVLSVISSGLCLASASEVGTVVTTFLDKNVLFFSNDLRWSPIADDLENMAKSRCGCHAEPQKVVSDKAIGRPQKSCLFLSKLNRQMAASVISPVNEIFYSLLRRTSIPLHPCLFVIERRGRRRPRRSRTRPWPSAPSSKMSMKEAWDMFQVDIMFWQLYECKWFKWKKEQWIWKVKYNFCKERQTIWTFLKLEKNLKITFFVDCLIIKHSVRMGQIKRWILMVLPGSHKMWVQLHTEWWI